MTSMDPDEWRGLIWVWFPYDIPGGDLMDAVLCPPGVPSIEAWDCDMVVMKRHKSFVEPLYGVWRW
jgi:hypothetical protein